MYICIKEQKTRVTQVGGQTPTNDLPNILYPNYLTNSLRQDLQQYLVKLQVTFTIPKSKETLVDQMPTHDMKQNKLIFVDKSSCTCHW